MAADSSGDQIRGEGGQPPPAWIYETHKDSLGLATAIDQASQTIWIADLDGSILYVNTAFTRMTGYSNQEATGQPSSLLKSGRQDQAYYQNLWATIRAGRIWKGELVQQRKDGTAYTEEMTIAPVCDSSGDIVRYIALADSGVIGPLIPVGSGPRFRWDLVQSSGGKWSSFWR